MTNQTTAVLKVGDADLDKAALKGLPAQICELAGAAPGGDGVMRAGGLAGFRARCMAIGVGPAPGESSVWNEWSAPAGPDVMRAGVSGRARDPSDAFGIPGAETSMQVRLRLPGQIALGVAGIHYNYFRDYDAETGRYLESDPVGLEGGLNTYGYLRQNPLVGVDYNGLDIAIIEGGPTADNPIGHTAAAVTGAGMRSYGNGTPLGSSPTDYVRQQSGRRDQRLLIISTTPEQDRAFIEYLRRFPDSTLPKGPLGLFGFPIAVLGLDNCAVRVNDALTAAGFPAPPIEMAHGDLTIPYYGGDGSPGMPGTAGRRAKRAGAKVIAIPKGGTPLPLVLRQFEPH